MRPVLQALPSQGPTNVVGQHCYPSVEDERAIDRVNHAAN